MSLSFPSERHALLEAALKMASLGLNEGAAGNVSLRVEEGILVTPSALPYDEMGPADIVLLDWEGETLDSPAGRKPTSEWRFHRDILASRPEFSAVAHCHSPFATTIASWERSIPAVHYMIALAGGNDIRCAPYATFGTQALSDAVLGALEGRRACLMANHGLLSANRDLETALAVALEVEQLAAAYLAARAAGEPVLLDDGEMDRVIEKFRTYGPGAGGG